MASSRRRALSVLGVATALVLAGCAASSGPAESATPSAAVMVARPSCTAAEQGDFWLPPGATDDTGAVFTLGTGKRGVLLAPQSDGDICQWLPQGRRLAAAGYRVAMFNWAVPSEKPVIDAAQRLRVQGATKVVLVGASQGGAYVLGLAGQLAPDGVVSLSGEASFGELENLDRIKAYAGPLLLVGSEDDGYTPGDATRKLAQAHPGSEQVIILPGSAHGLALLTDSQVLTAFDRFLARHTR